MTGEASLSGAGFSLVGPQSYSLDTGETMTLTVRYEPVELGEASGTLNLTGADGATVPLSGKGGTGPNLMVSATSVVPGGSVQVTVSDGPGNRLDWVALAKVGSSLTSYVDWRYLSGTRTDSRFRSNKRSTSMGASQLSVLILSRIYFLVRSILAGLSKSAIRKLVLGATTV